MKQAAAQAFLEAPARPIRPPLVVVGRGAQEAKPERRADGGQAALQVRDLERCLHEQKDGLLITNGEGVGLWVNRAMRWVVGLTPDYFINKPIRHLFESGVFQYQAVTEEGALRQKRAHRLPGREHGPHGASHQRAPC